MNRSTYKIFLMTTAFLISFGSAVMACGAGDYSDGSDKGEPTTTTETE